MRVRLNRKLAEVMEGVDLSHFDEGDIIELPEPDAKLLIAGAWAIPVSSEERVGVTTRARAADAAELPRRRDQEPPSVPPDDRADATAEPRRPTRGSEQ